MLSSSERPTFRINVRCRAGDWREELEGASCPDVVLFAHNAAGEAAGNLQTLVAQRFPEAFAELRPQAQAALAGASLSSTADEVEEDLIPDKRCSDSVIPRAVDAATGVTLLAPVLYPLGGDGKNIRVVVRGALREVWGRPTARPPAVHRDGGEDAAPANPPNACVNILRILTHALGGFTGHPHVHLLARRLVEGVVDFVEEELFSSNGCIEKEVEERSIRP